MEAPKKDVAEQTGNFKALAITIVFIVVIGGIFAFAAGLPASNSNESGGILQQTPQVAGQTTEDEYVAPEDTAEPLATTNDIDNNYYKVTAVVDGDTIKVLVDGKTETVRLIGVDTPETKDPRKPVQCFGIEASNFSKKSLLSQSVRLVQDDSQQNRDKYGRLLRYIYLSDGTLFNQLLIASGYAYEYTYNVPYNFQTDFKAAAADAQLNQVGLWNNATCGGKI